MAKLYRVIIPVSDIDTAQQFYSQIFDDAGSRVSPGRHYFDCEGTILACYDPGADGDAHEARPNPDHVYLAVDDLDDCYARCRAALANPYLLFRSGDGEKLFQKSSIPNRAVSGWTSIAPGSPAPHSEEAYVNRTAPPRPSRSRPWVLVACTRSVECQRGGRG